ncbi:MAG: CopD family protein [Curvibacter sp.]|jgi:uncharacterized membrane protein|nr:CopD family protein [Curvibacter sp.]
MLYALLKTIHVLSILVWVGGMAFAHFFLRPAVSRLEAPERLRLMHDVLGRFFSAVLWAAGLTLVSGLWMIGRVAKQLVQGGGSFAMPLEWTVMAALGVVMVVIFGHIRFALYTRLSLAVAAQQWPSAGESLGHIRRWVSINLGLGVTIVVVTLIGLPG